eukprot:jgi/Botrbrau1/11047/Bobra.92_2s0018.1
MTYRLENTLNYGMERLWALGYVKGSNSVALGYDEGAVLIKIGREEPVASMDTSGKIIWARHNEVQTVNVKSLGADHEDADGERLPLAVKDLGSCDLYPQQLVHNPNGRFVTVCGDGEYIIYTALAWRNKSFGTALEFVWGSDSSVFATRESTTSVKVFKNFKETAALRPGFAAEGIYGGALLGIRSSDFICFYDWTTTKVVRRVDVPVRDVKWSESGNLLAIVSDASFYLLRYDQATVDSWFDSEREIDEDGIEDAFELITEVSERVRTGLWVGDCFIYNNAAWRLNYCVGGEVTVMYHLDRPMYLLGYLASQQRVYLIDKEFGVVSYTLLLSLIEYKTAVMREDMEAAAQILPSIPTDQMNNVAKFLEGRGLPEQAMEVATDPDYRFELAVQLGDLDIALSIAQTSESETKWRQLGELAMSAGKLDVAETCLNKAKDLSGLLLLYTARGSAKGLESLAPESEEAGRANIAFLSLFLLGRISECVDLLLASNRVSEAAFFARTYMPSRVSEVVQLWRKDLAKINPKAAESLADPAQYPNLFPDLDLALEAEKLQADLRKRPIPAARYAEMDGVMSKRDLIAEVRALHLGGAEPHIEAEANGIAHEFEAEDKEGVLEEELEEVEEDPSNGYAPPVHQQHAPYVAAPRQAEPTFHSPEAPGPVEAMEAEIDAEVEDEENFEADEDLEGEDFGGDDTLDGEDIGEEGDEDWGLGDDEDETAKEV